LDKVLFPTQYGQQHDRGIIRYLALDKTQQQHTTKMGNIYAQQREL